MGTYVVNSKKEQQELLTRCGLNSFVDLYKDIPEEVLLKDGLNLPKGLAELEVKRKLSSLFDFNRCRNFPYLFRTGRPRRNNRLVYNIIAVDSQEALTTKTERFLF